MSLSEHNRSIDAEADPPAVRETEPMSGGSPSAECARDRGFNRRRALKWLIRLGFGAFALALALPALALRSLTRVTQAVDISDILVYAATAPDAPVGQPLQADVLEVGEATQVFPRDKADDQNNLIEVVRLAPGPEGLVAYSAICTHLGCAVYAKLSADGYIVCPCHASIFDPSEDAEVVAGPAPRPLPSLPVTISDDGVVIVAGHFSAPVGPQ